MIVLIAEDNALLAFMVEDALEESGHTVLGPASTPATAIQLAEQTRPDLAIIDIDLEDKMSGVELARLLKQRWDVPALFATGQSAVARANSDAALGMVTKPFSPAAIVQSIEAARRLLRGESRVEAPPELEWFNTQS